MRATSAGDDDALAAMASHIALKIEVKNAGGSWVDYSALAGKDWQERCEISQDANQRVAQANVQLAREIDGDSIAPLMDTAVDAGRAIRVSASRVEPGDSPSFEQIFLGVVDDWEAAEDPLGIVARDDSGGIVDAVIEEDTDYSSAGTPIEDVMQAILDDWAPTWTLYVPVTPGFDVEDFVAGQGPVIDALQALAEFIGWVLEYRWDDGTSAYRLTFYEPDRTPAATDWTFGPDDYYSVRQLNVSRLDIRNRVIVNYIDESTGLPAQYMVEETTSQGKYDLRVAIFNEGSDSPISTAAEAQAMGDAALADLSLPVATQEIEVDLFWPIQIGDYYEFLANGKHYSADQTFGVVGFRHVFENGTGRTFITTRGTPVGQTHGWLRRERKKKERKEREDEIEEKLDEDEVIHDPDQIADGVIIARHLIEAAQGYGFTGDFTASDWDTAAWTAGDLWLTNGTTYSIVSGNVSMPDDDPIYIYFDASISTTVLQTTDDLDTATVGDGRLFIAVAWRAPSAAGGAAVVPSVGKLRLNEENLNVNSVATNHLQVNSVTSVKIDVVALSAISADIGTATAGRLQNAGNTFYIDLDATGTDPLIHADEFEILADGSAVFSGIVAAETFTGTTATFTGSIVVEDGQGGDRVALYAEGLGYGTLRLYDELGDDAGGLSATGGQSLMLYTPEDLTIWADAGGIRFASGAHGFFGVSPVAKPTGVAVSAAGIHAALVTLGLIAA